MDKLTRTVTIMVAIIIAVSAVLLAFFLTRSNEQKVESSSSVDTDEKATLVSPSIEHVQSMKITNQYGTYTIVPVSYTHLSVLRLVPFVNVLVQVRAYE